MIKTGLIGHPISHSKSPLIHTHWMAQHGIDGSYEAIDVECGSVESCMKTLASDGYAGFNVTVPHKEAVFALCDKLDAAAAAIGAVNTVEIKDGKFYGRNTDAFGFIQNLKNHAPDFDFNAGPAFVLGAGGAAKAIVYALIQEGAPQVVICNRTAAKAQQFAQQYPGHIRIQDWDQRSNLDGVNVLVNTTSLGMTGSAPLEIDLDLLPSHALVSDIVYVPLETDLLRTASAKGNFCVNGIGMLLHQARPAFEAWHGILPDVDAELEDKVLS